MPSVSKAQQRFMGIVDQYKKTGKLPPYGEKFKKKIKDAADSMTNKQVSDFSETSTKNLPEKKANAGDAISDAVGNDAGNDVSKADIIFTKLKNIDANANAKI